MKHKKRSDVVDTSYLLSCPCKKSIPFLSWPDPENLLSENLSLCLSLSLSLHPPPISPPPPPSLSLSLFIPSVPFFALSTLQVVDKNDFPTDILLNHSSVLENSPSGTVIGTLSSVDEDKGQTLICSVLPFGNVTDSGKC